MEAALDPEQRVLLIQDREGDVFDFLAAPRRPATDLLVRAAQPRNVTIPGTEPAAGEPPAQLFAVAAAAPVVGSLSVKVPAKGQRRERTATLTLRACPVLVQPPVHRPPGAAAAAPQQLWVLRAAEEQPPAEAPAIAWVLLTTRPVEEAVTAAELVGYYALRWRLERLHYVLKSGLKAEALQHGDATVQPALALYYLVAWHLLLCTYLARTEPEAPATAVFEPTEVQVLSAAVGQPLDTVEDAYYALARLVGYQRYRGSNPPGVKRLWWGYRRLQDLVLGYELRARSGNCGKHYV